MASKIEVLNDPTYGQYITIGIILVARDVIGESIQVVLGNRRRDFAHRLLEDPLGMVEVFKHLVIVDFDTTNWATFTETQKINGAKLKIANVFHEAGRIH